MDSHVCEYYENIHLAKLEIKFRYKILGIKISNSKNMKNCYYSYQSSDWVSPKFKGEISQCVK